MSIKAFLERIAKVNEKQFQGLRLSNSKLNRPRRNEGNPAFVSTKRKCG